MESLNDRIRDLLLTGAHEEGDYQALLSPLFQAELFAAFSGGIQGDPAPIGFGLDIYKHVLPVFTHEQMANANVRIEHGVWVDVISIRQAIQYVISHQWHGVFVNFRDRGWLIEGDLLRQLKDGLPQIV